MEKVSNFYLEAVVIDSTRHSVRLASGDSGRIVRLASDLFPVLDCSLQVVDDAGRIVCALVKCTRPGDKVCLDLHSMDEVDSSN